MTTKSKKIFLIMSIVVPFLAYCFYYYGMMIKNAPYKFSEFQSLHFEYGFGDTLNNIYDSKTGEYQFVNRRDSLVKINMRLSKEDLLYLHRKAADLGFWDFPANELDTAAKGKVPRYSIQLNYLRKTKKVMFDASFDGDPKLKDANERLIKEIRKILDDAEARQRNTK